MKHAWPWSILLMLALACASSSSRPSDTADDFDDDSEISPTAGEGLPPASGPSHECLDEENEPVECETDEECAGCDGFYCGLDPQGSTRQKICIWGGGGE